MSTPEHEECSCFEGGSSVCAEYDMEVLMSERAHTVLEFMRAAVERYGDAGQPLWPVVPSLLYGAFLAGEVRDARILVIMFDTSVDG
jgi:hypothetical protein